MSGKNPRKLARRSTLTLLGVVVAATGLGAYRVQSAPSKPDFALSVSPTSQSVASGSVATATYSVTIARAGGFSSSVTLSVTGLVGSGISVAFNPASSVAGSATTMTLTTSASTAAKIYSLTLSGSGGGLTRTAAFALNVQAPTPTFTIGASPSAQTITQNDQATFDVALNKVNGFNSTVALSVAGLPKKSTASFAPASTTGSSVLTVVTASNSDVGTFPLTITGIGGDVTQTATVTLVVEKKQAFLIAGDASPPALVPGAAAPLDLTLTNSNSFTIRVTGLTAAVEERTSNPGCSGTHNFQTHALVGYVDVPAKTTKKLSELGVSAANVPTVTFAATAANQDACKHVQITLQYSGTAVKP